MKDIFLHIIKLISILVGFALFFSCEKDIDLKLPDYKDKIVIEGTIENGQPPTVLITKSLPYFSSIPMDSLMSKFLVTDAIVTVTSGSGEIETLNFTLDLNSPIFFSYKGHNVARENETYTLKVEWDNKIYTASTKIVNTFDLDSIGFNRVGDSSATVRVLLQDNPASKDYYQFSCKVKHGKVLNDRLWVYNIPIAFDDATFNGLQFNYEVMRGIPSSLFASALSEEEQRSYFRPIFRLGDTVYVKHSLMDYDSYRFWSTAGSEIMFGQNGFISPPPIIGNIKCNDGSQVLGAWCGYASKIDMLIFK